MRAGHLEISGGFFLLLAWLNYLDRQGVVPLAMAACVLHELGHYGAICLMGGNVKEIRLTAIGAEMVLSRPLDYWQEGAAALAGPAVNLLLARLCCLWEGGALFAGINLALGCFNLLPVYRLDGGRALSCAVALLAGPDAAWRAGKWISQIIAALLLTAALLLFVLGGSVTLLLASLWLAAAGNNYISERK